MNIYYQYSPYDNIKPQNYPPTWIISGLTDPRIPYWESLKMTAKLRKYKTDDNLLLFTMKDSGHIGDPGKYGRVKEKSQWYNFIVSVLFPELK